MLPLHEIPQTAEECVCEAFEILRRGHSLHPSPPACRCRWRQHICKVGTTRQGCSVKDVEHDLGECSLNELAGSPGGKTLSLVKCSFFLAGMTRYNGSVASTSVCCVPPEVTTTDHIIASPRALSKRPDVTRLCLYGMARTTLHADKVT
jgi:hypothetical protein